MHVDRDDAAWGWRNLGAPRGPGGEGNVSALPRTARGGEGKFGAGVAGKVKDLGSRKLPSPQSLSPNGWRYRYMFPISKDGFLSADALKNVRNVGSGEKGSTRGRTAPLGQLRVTLSYEPSAALSRGRRSLKGSVPAQLVGGNLQLTSRPARDRCHISDAISR